MKDVNSLGSGACVRNSMLSRVQQSRQPDVPKSRDGNQTLARGLKVFLAIVDADHGMTVQQVGDLLEVHRSIAYRLLQTLSDFGLVARNGDGAYLPGPRLATLAEAYLPALREVAAPIMRTLADRLESTVSLFVEQGHEAVAVAMVEPTTASHHIAFKPGMRTTMSQGAAAYSILAGSPAIAGEPDAVAAAREAGFARSHGEVESGAYGVAAWVPVRPGVPRACLNLITYRADIAEIAGPDMRAAADELGGALQQEI
jgi:DNA-binding IclR family transcriptional regulator